MGMYDTLRCQYPLPLPQFQDRDWQTKDLPSCWLWDYCITQDGRLMLMSNEHEEVEPPQRVLVSGNVWFYGFYDDTPGMGVDHGWIEFKATFKDDLCVGIELADERKPEIAPGS